MFSNLYKRPFVNPYLFVYLLPVFFILHVCADNSFFPLKEVGFLFLEYILVITVFIFVLNPFIKHLTNRLLFIFCLIFIQLFFGPIHDFLKTHFEGTFLIKYKFLIPFLNLLFVLLFIVLKRSKKNHLRLTQFLNFTLCILILIDTWTLIIKINTTPKPTIANITEKLKPFNQKNKPDIYLIIVDEYAGLQELNDIFHYDNKPFLDSLNRLGFRTIKNSTSNYNHTVYSMTSLLNMEYIYNLKQKENNRDFLYCLTHIKKNEVVKFFQEKEYQFNNFSIFPIWNRPPLVVNRLVTRVKELFNYQTFLYRVWIDIGFNTFSDAKIASIIKGNFYNNQKVEQHLLENSKQNKLKPTFTYAHLVMPHYPYYFDNQGRFYPIDTITENFKFNKTAYLNNLIHANKRLLAIAKTILKTSRTPPIILMMSDHGFRQFTEKVNKKYYLMNLNAIYLPSKNYSGFYDGMSNVNQFRVLLNSEFNQNLPLLKDTSFFIWEK